jgi:PAS domain S-box-containing protein
MSIGLLAWFAAAIVVLVAARVVNTLNLRDLHAQSEAAAHTRAVQEAVQQVLVTALDAETGGRGFVITGAASFLEPYERARTSIAGAIAQARALTADNRDQQADLDRLSATADARIAEMTKAIELRRALDIAGAQAVIQSARGKQMMDEIRAIIARMDAREAALLSIRTAQMERSYRSGLITGFSTTGLALIAVVALFFATRRVGLERLHAAEIAERLRITLTSIGDAVIATDDQGCVQHMNPIAERLTGWKEADACHKQLDEVLILVNEQTRRPVESPVDRVLKEGTIVGLANHTILISRDRSEIPIDDSAAPIRTSDGEVIGVVMVFRDVVERRRAERERAALLKSEQAARVEAEAAVRARDEFLSIASHELRNPVNAVQLQLLGVLRELERGGDALKREWLHRRLGQAQGQVSRLIRLIDNLLDVSRITADAAVLEPENVDARETVRSAIEQFREELKPDQAVVRLPDKPVVGYWDPVRLDQIVTNLLSNAIKYGEAKPIDLSVRTENGEVHFSITDHGIGIEPDRRQQLFRQFERAVSRRQYGGFGLGLWITKRLVEAMGGTISVKSKPGDGSTFTVVLPRGSARSQNVLMAAQDSSGQGAA